MINEEKLESILFDIEAGRGDPLLAYAEISKAKALLDEALKQVKGEALLEAEKYGEKTFEYNGITFERRAGRRSYNYSQDDVWTNLDMQKREREGLMKQAENNEIYDNEGAKIYPPIVTFAKDSLIIK